ncbi:MAG: hypothetical protein ACMVO5_08100 [Polymorphobacter sp.]|uniref:hypothetical protein n=1 Tax=Polymorphobacter sp. TaxID=1909290 RepID=UPI003A862699
MSQQDCDIVMRGGITSGLVYPAALAALAPHWRFRNIGGASAGAIAAGVLAAAEHGRRSGKNSQAFDLIAAIPAQMSGGRMRQLFPASRGLEPVMALVWQWLAARKAGTTPLRFALSRLATLSRLPFLSALAIAVMMSLVGWSFGALGAGLGWAFFVFTLAFILLIAAELSTLVDAVSGLHKAFLRAGLGLSSGSVQRWQANPPGLDNLQAEGGFADWIHALIQRAAGRADGDAPLTIGDLWTTDRPDQAPDAWDEARDIDLLLTTTNLSQAIPASFPFLERTGTMLFFREDDLRAVLPGAIVDHLIAVADKRHAHEHDGQRYHRLPLPQQLPVALGVRLSLSFPGLISAVRLFAATRIKGGKPDGALDPLWFSDGGITSNFPVTVFDAPLPSRPTFCINLADIEEARWGTNADPVVDLAEDNSDGLTVPLQAAPTAGVLRFVTSIVGAARNGRENELLAMAGQRDRIVSILLDPQSQGGLNLDMDEATIAQLNDAGKEAAARLNTRFAATDAPAPGWTNHRWVRLRSTLAAIEALSVSYARGWRRVDGQGLSFAGHEAKLSVSKAPAYRFADKAAHEAALHWAGTIATSFAALEKAQPGWPEQSLMNGSRNRNDALSRTRHAAPRPGARLALQPNPGRDPHKG